MESYQQNQENHKMVHARIDFCWRYHVFQTMGNYEPVAFCSLIMDGVMFYRDGGILQTTGTIKDIF